MHWVVELFIKNMLKKKKPKNFLNVLFSITNRDLEAFARRIMQCDCKYPLNKVEWLKHPNERWESPTYINKTCYSIATRAKPWVMLPKSLEYINVLFIFTLLKVKFYSSKCIENQFCVLTCNNNCFKFSCNFLGE